MLCHLLIHCPRRPPALTVKFLARFPSYQRLSCSETKEFAGEGRLHTTYDATVLLVRSPTPPPPSAPNDQRGAQLAFRKMNLLAFTCLCSYVVG